MFEPVKHQRVADAVFNQIMESIIQQKIKPGNRLPSERDIAEQMECSRSAVREAIKMLESIGVVEIVKGAHGGCFVKESNISNVANSISLMYRLGQISIPDFVEVRKMLEMSGLSLVVERMTDEDLEKLEKNVRELEIGYQDPEFLITNNRDFHMMIASFTKNKLFMMLMNTILDSIDFSITQLITSNEQGQKILLSHQIILEALKSRDLNKVRKAMERHFDGMQKSFEKLLNERNNLERNF